MTVCHIREIQRNAVQKAPHAFRGVTELQRNSREMQYQATDDLARAARARTAQQSLPGPGGLSFKVIRRYVR